MFPLGRFLISTWGAWIIADLKKREIPRFRAEPPGQSVAMATQLLLKAQAGDSLLVVLDPLRDFRMQDMGDPGHAPEDGDLEE